MKDFDLVLTSDWHIRKDAPVCRVDDFQFTFWNKVKFVASLSKPILHAGDLTDTWNLPHAIVNHAIANMPKDFYTIAGNHDLPFHNMDNFDKSALATLVAAGAINLLPGPHYKQEAQCSYEIQGRKILVIHQGVYKGKADYKGSKDIEATKLLKKYPEFDLIVTGHNHKPLKVEYKGRLLINPGSITRQRASEIDYKPHVWLYKASNNTAKKLYIPIDEGATSKNVSREHLAISEERDLRINTFINKLHKGIGDTESFEQTLQQLIKVSKAGKGVQRIITRVLETSNPNKNR